MQDLATWDDCMHVTGGALLQVAGLLSQSTVEGGPNGTAAPHLQSESSNSVLYVSGAVS